MTHVEVAFVTPAQPSVEKVYFCSDPNMALGFIQGVLSKGGTITSVKVK